VLSGEKHQLEEYECAIRKQIYEINECEETHYDMCHQLRYGSTLDVKYCHLRQDIPTEKQLFNSLSVKVTNEVVSLNNENNESNHRKKGKRSRKSKEKNFDSSTTHSPSQNYFDPSITKHKASDVSKQLEDLDVSGFEPAPHLSPKEWNERLMLFSKNQKDTNVMGIPSEKTLTNESNQISTGHIQSNAHNKTNTNNDMNPSFFKERAVNMLEDSVPSTTDGAILVDARNIYESRIGHFSVDGVSTLLTNTRKYSALPEVFNSSMQHLAGKNVFLYCTGGVRCERASMYLQALAKSDRWPDQLDKPKAIFQLKGGIQKYLEEYGKFNPHSFRLDSPCLFKGKNFVFDPRRFDPVVGKSTLGCCLICSKPHDDYDNGHAPNENKEARCCRCRVLILICNHCREKARELKRELFCGPGGNHCIDEGNKGHYQVVQSQQE